MNRPLAALILSVTFAVPAMAADLGGSIKDTPRYEPAPMSTPWTGFYVGLNGGYAFSGNDRIGIQANDGTFWTDGTMHVGGGFGGGQFGFNHQSGNIVAGFEADIQASGIRDSVGPSATVPAGLTVTGKSDVNWFATIRGRLGVAQGPFLFYATGGVAFAGVDYTVSTTGLATSTMKNDDILLGWTVGGGVEYALDRRWSVKAEYMYVDFGRTAVTGPVTAGPFAAMTTLETPDFHSVRIGINYKLY